MLNTPGFSRAETQINHKIESILETMGIAQHADTEVGDLPYVIQRRVEISRALCLEPVVLLLDEPTAGLNNKEVDEICKDLGCSKYGFIRDAIKEKVVKIKNERTQESKREDPGTPQRNGQENRRVEADPAEDID